jgi:CubicO group peptidase (beta-lactamase class C family)
VPGDDARARLFLQLERAAADGVFPGCVGLVWRRGELVYHEAHGVLATHPGLLASGAPVRRDTMYDLASLTKVLCTASLAAIAVGSGRVALDDAPPPRWADACPGARLCDLLEHCAGLAAHREYFLETAAGDRAGLLARVAATAPECPARTRPIYSDLGFMILGDWLERCFDAPLDEAFDRHVAGPLGIGGTWDDSLRFRPLGASALGREALAIAPTEVYDAKLHAGVAPSWFALRSGQPCAHGEVHDDNAWAMGGVAGHAGLFGPALAVLALARAWLDGQLPAVAFGLRDRFWTASTLRGSTRRLGFDGPAPDGSGSTGGALSPGAVGHTGFTGTSLWIDPAHEGVYVLLSNRVHPTRRDDRIQGVRAAFHRLAVQL